MKADRTLRLGLHVCGHRPVHTSTKDKIVARWDLGIWYVKGLAPAGLKISIGPEPALAHLLPKQTGVVLCTAAMGFGIQ